MGGKGSGRNSGIDWVAVDWSLPDAEIARRVGVSREGVRRARQRAGVGGPAPAASARFRAYVRAHRQSMDGLATAQAVAASGTAVAREVARQILRRAGVRPCRVWRRPPSKLNGADWRLPNADLARLCGLDERTVATRRSQHGKPKALWDPRDSRAGRDPEYRKAVKAEQARVKGMT